MNNYIHINIAVDLKLAPGKKRVHVANDSSSDEGSPNKLENAACPQSLSVKDKEELLIAIKKQEPEYDTMVTFQFLKKQVIFINLL